MKRQIIFRLEDTDSFFRLTKDYFFRTGFKLRDENENQISFVKGSTFRNIVTFNPLNWKSDVTIKLQSDIVVADFDINTVGQLITPKEEKLWDTFIENYKVSLTDKVDVIMENNRHLKETKKDSWKYVRWAVIGALVFGVPFGFLAYLTKMDILASMGAAFGAVFFMMYKVNKERKKNAL